MIRAGRMAALPRFREVNEMEHDGRVSGNDYTANEINAVSSSSSSDGYKRRRRRRARGRRRLNIYRHGQTASVHAARIPSRIDRGVRRGLVLLGEIASK